MLACSLYAKKKWVIHMVAFFLMAEFNLFLNASNSVLNVSHCVSYLQYMIIYNYDRPNFIIWYDSH